MQVKALLYMLMRNERCRRKEEASKVKTNSKAKQQKKTKPVTFPKENEPPRVGFEPTTLHTLDRVLYQLSYRM